MRRVRRQGVIEKFLGFFYVYPFRCQLCGYRFRLRQPGVRYTRMDEDRREYQRIPVRFAGKLITDEKDLSATLLDLSMAGCTVAVDAALAVGTVVGVELQAEDQPPISIEAAVVRSARPGIVGLEFLRFHGNERDRLQSLVRTLLFMPKQ